MRQHFGISIGSEPMAAFALQLLAQRRVVFDHAVVHQSDFAALVEMWMRIFVGYFSMGGPASVADPVLPRGRFFGHQFGEVRDAPRAFPRLDLPAIYDRDAGGIVTAIFETAQTVEKYGRRFLPSDVSDNSTHNFRREIIAYFWPIALCPGLVDERARPSFRAAQRARDLTKINAVARRDVPFLSKALRTSETS